MDEQFYGDVYYKNTIGVTVLNDEQLQDVILKVDRDNAPYGSPNFFIIPRKFWNEHPMEV